MSFGHELLGLKERPVINQAGFPFNISLYKLNRGEQHGDSLVVGWNLVAFPLNPDAPNPQRACQMEL